MGWILMTEVGVNILNQMFLSNGHWQAKQANVVLFDQCKRLIYSKYGEKLNLKKIQVRNYFRFDGHQKLTKYQTSLYIVWVVVITTGGRIDSLVTPNSFYVEMSSDKYRMIPYFRSQISGFNFFPLSSFSVFIFSS